ncbi:MarR family winged helix-turn-helix transcriptional regulator [Pseudomonas bohemica]|uniref:MarR family winged helix-turn-helix transcriptional regulator n=1 Tax=Pseudomonas bohemica TaxID=2044872 RepID=UPI0018FE2C75|nr:MarR family winged helix-turn-helix transcriptional regulator [Pseudomonas bohemica]
MSVSRGELELEFSSGVAPLYQLWRAAANLAITPESDLSHSLAWPLVVLRQTKAPLKQHELAARLALEKSTVARLVEQLYHAGYIYRLPDLHDRRAKTVGLTSKGCLWADRLEPLVTQFRARTLAHVSDEELGVCVSVFARLRAALDTSPPGREN